MAGQLIRFVGILSLLASMGIAQAQSPTIRVLVNAMHQGSNTVYHYTVVNNGDVAFNNITIGSVFDNALGKEIPQLDRLPLGWTYGREGETGTAIILDPASTTQPSYWTPRVYGQQDISYYYLEWDTPFGDGTLVVRPGQTLSGFSVTVPSEDLDLRSSAEMYLKGSFKVSYFDAQNVFRDVWGALERLDTTPPTLTLTVSPTRLQVTAGKLVTVSATLITKDDYDPAPAIKLESITANESLAAGDIVGAAFGTDDRQFQLRDVKVPKGSNGRVYTITYSATDASGNKTTASATVSVK